MQLVGFVFGWISLPRLIPPSESLLLTYMCNKDKEENSPAQLMLKRRRKKVFWIVWKGCGHWVGVCQAPQNLFISKSCSAGEETLLRLCQLLLVPDTTGRTHLLRWGGKRTCLLPSRSTWGSEISWCGKRWLSAWGRWSWWWVCAGAWGRRPGVGTSSWCRVCAAPGTVLLLGIAGEWAQLPCNLPVGTAVIHRG